MASKNDSESIEVSESEKASETKKLSELEVNLKIVKRLLSENLYTYDSLIEQLKAHNFFVVGLCFLCILLGIILLLIKKDILDISFVGNVVVSSITLILTGSSVIMTLKDIISKSENSGERRNNIIFEDNTSMFGEQDLEMILDKNKKLIKKNKSLKNAKVLQSVWAFFGSVILLSIAGFDFLTIVSKKHIHIALDITMIVIGCVGLLHCISVCIILGIFPFMEKWLTYLFPFLCGIGLTRKKMPKGVLLPDEEQESYIYIINGIKNDSPMLYKLIQELNADDEKPGDTDWTTNANPKITKDAQEITNAEQGLIRLYYDLGEELSKQTSNELNDDDKKIESAQKIYSLFHMIGKDKINNIGRLKSFTASSILELSSESIKRVTDKK